MSDIPDGWEERTSRSSGKPGTSGSRTRTAILWHGAAGSLKVHPKLIVVHASRYEILCEPVHEAVAVGGAYEGCGEGIERQGSGEAPASQARGVTETELVEAGGYLAHKGKASKSAFNAIQLLTTNRVRKGYIANLILENIFRICFSSGRGARDSQGLQRADRIG